jgi:hypothetical protein
MNWVLSHRKSQNPNRKKKNEYTDDIFNKAIDVNLACYPPYHSKYNPVERVWGVLENHWRGQLLDSVEKVIGLAKTMRWNGKNPVVKVIDKVYETGVRLSKSAMQVYEDMIERLPGLENWFVNISCFDQ